MIITYTIRQLNFSLRSNCNIFHAEKPLLHLMLMLAFTGTGTEGKQAF